MRPRVNRSTSNKRLSSTEAANCEFCHGKRIVRHAYLKTNETDEDTHACVSREQPRPLASTFKAGAKSFQLDFV